MAFRVSGSALVVLAILARGMVPAAWESWEQGIVPASHPVPTVCGRNLHVMIVCQVILGLNVSNDALVSNTAAVCSVSVEETVSVG